MSENTTKVIVTRRLPEIVEARMMELFDTKLNADDHPFSSEELVNAVDEADILVPTVTDIIDKKILDSTKRRIKMIANFGAGVDHIDLEYTEKNGQFCISIVKENVRLRNRINDVKNKAQKK